MGEFSALLRGGLSFEEMVNGSDCLSVYSDGQRFVKRYRTFLTYRVFVWSYAHVSPDSFFARLARGLVNYIGRTPIAAVVF